MSSARARLGKARRKLIKRERQTGMFSNILSDIASAATFAAGQAKKSKTAWGEYEAGYKAMGGEGFERPKFGEEGYFKGPEGDVRIGDTLYDRSKLQKAGSFLGSDASAILDEGAREQYLKRVAPGRDLKSIQKPSSIPSSTAGSAVPPTTKPSWPTLQDYNQNVVQEQGMGEGWLDSLKLKQTMGSGSDRGFAHGGDFITSGPEKILVGDNPGGRERVIIIPLDSEDYKPKGYYGEARNLLESLYENNRLRKKY